jgi:hypothetical protein
VIHLDRRLGIVVAAANLRAPKHNALTQRVQASHAEGFKAREESGGMPIVIQRTHDERNTLLHRCRGGCHSSAVEHAEENSQVLIRLGTH